MPAVASVDSLPTKAASTTLYSAVTTMLIIEGTASRNTSRGTGVCVISMYFLSSPAMSQLRCVKDDWIR